VSTAARAVWSAVGPLLPRARDYEGVRRSWRTDVVAGLTVGVVALPLALAFGITTGLGAQAGLITAIVAGLVAAVFGGSNVQVSGPTGAMTVVLVPVVARYGGDAVYVVGLMAGVLIVLAAIVRLGRLLAYIPWPVIEGFTVGIALIIFLQQVPAALGVPKPEGENVVVVAVRAARDALDGSGAIAAVGVVAAVAAVMVVLPRLHRALPASLLAVVVATVAVQVTNADVAVIGTLPDSLPFPALPSMSANLVSELFGAAFAVAALAAIESLLSAKVADGMAGTGHHDPDRELFGQGLANLASPLFGGMPATGAIARTAVNVRSGAKTRLAAAVHAVVLLAIVYLASGMVSRIPLAALGGVLMVTAVRMVSRRTVAAILRSTRSDAAVFILTAVITVAFDLIVAIQIGLAAAALFALRTFASLSSVQREEVPGPRAEGDEHIAVLRLDGAMFFGAAERILQEISQVKDVQVAIIRLSQLRMLDATGAHALVEVVSALELRGITVLLKGVRPDHLQLVTNVGVIRSLRHHKHLFGHLGDAVEHARSHVRRNAAYRL
jgi:SulP family sulfate permease